MWDAASAIHSTADCQGLRFAMFGDSAADLPARPRWLCRRLGTGCGNGGESPMDAWDGQLSAGTSWRSSGWENRTGLASRACRLRNSCAGNAAMAARFRDHGPICRSAISSESPWIREIRRDSPAGSSANRAADTWSALSRSRRVFPGASGPRWGAVSALRRQPCSGDWCGDPPLSGGGAGPATEGEASRIRSCARLSVPRAAAVGNRAASRSGRAPLC